MLQLLNQKIENGFVTREYSRDGETISHVVTQPIEQQREEETIVLPKDPIVALREENEKMKQQVNQTNEDLQFLMEYLAGGAE